MRIRLQGEKKSAAACLSFSEKGARLAERIAGMLGGTADRCGGSVRLDAWVREHFPVREALVFVGAAGIAVRAIAPYVKSKTEDPAVVAVDECGTYAVPLLSGHLGGANDLARRIASFLGAEAVITTATDANRIFAADEWAKRQNMRIADPMRIRDVSSALLGGKCVRVESDYPIGGVCPPGLLCGTCAGSGAGCAAAVLRVTCRTTDAGSDPDVPVLRAVPRILVLGIGCRIGVSAGQIDAFFSSFLDRNGYAAEGVFRVCSIERKAEEPGILDFCRSRGYEYAVFTAEELNAVPGSFSASDYVRSVTGVDNVCERSAVLGASCSAAETSGRLLVRKEAGDGITMALAETCFSPDWRWTCE